MLIYAFYRRENRIQRGIKIRILEAQDQERKRISRELHDNIGQELLALKLSLRDVPGAKVTFGDSVLNLINEVRALSKKLSPTSLDLGLHPALEELFKIGDKANLKVSCRLDSLDAITLSEVQSHAIFRIYQELFSNTIKHSRATEVYIAALNHHSGTIFWYRDNGIGFSPDNGKMAGIGINSIRERVDNLGGKIVFQSQPRAGTSVSIWIPQNAT